MTTPPYLPWNPRTVISAMQRLGASLDQCRLALTLQSRVRFARNYLRDPRGNPWQVRPYQIPSLESRALRKVHCSGRDVGKTSEIEIMCAWASICQPGRQMMVATQHEAHLAPLMRRIQAMFEKNPRLSPNIEKIRQSPTWHIEFKNGFQLFGRIAGPAGVNFQGMHVHWQLIDEAQNMSDDAWNQLYPALVTGGSRWIYGVPNGLRNQFYRLSRNPRYEQYHWPSRINPEYTDEKDREMLYLYGGSESPGYIHNVLGLHGSPEHSVFNLNAYAACVRDYPHFDCAITTPADIPDISGIIKSLGLDSKDARFYLGADLGFAQDPSELVVYAKTPQILINLGRIHMKNVDYAAQQSVIQALDDQLDFEAIGIDNGHSGIAVAHNLMALSQHLAMKIVPVPFGGTVQWDGGWDVITIRRFVKELLTEIMIRHISAKEVQFPPVQDRFNQYAGHTYSQSPSGRIIYAKGNDHIIDADRCAIMAINRHLLQPAEETPVSLTPQIAFF